MNANTQTPKNLILIENEDPSELRIKLNKLFDTVSKPLRKTLNEKTGARFKRTLIENVLTSRQKANNKSIGGTRYVFKCETRNEANAIGNTHREEFMSIFENNLNVRFKKLCNVEISVTYEISTPRVEEEE